MVPSRSSAAYRNPDKLKDAEQYSDPEDGGVEIVDMDEVHILDDLAPRALPRVAEKETKKDKQKAATARQKKMEGRMLKDEREAGGSAPGDGPQVNSADALDLSESEGEELMDDLVDDFVFHDDDDANPENRLYLFQFPQLFPKFRALKANKADATDAAATAEPSTAAVTGKRRTVSFAEGTAGGAGQAVKDELPSSEIDSDADSAIDSADEDKKTKLTTNNQHEGLVGKLDVYRDGRVFLRFGELVMEVTGGSQSTFLQQVMLLDPSNRTATSLGELHRKFIVSPELDCMLNDIKLHDEEERAKEDKRREEEQRKIEAERAKYGGGIGGVGGR
uniref:Uncharacterized protein n=1 Tax=Kalmanozyma brasiliensis (strain GHG001) TaxID=1365824 RepID=V5GS22_KALBG